MKKTIIIVLIFFISLFCFDRILSFLIAYAENNFFNQNLLEKPLRKYLKNKEFNTLLLGTSRTYEGIHPENLKEIKEMKIFKNAYVGHGPKYNYFFYKMYRKIKGQPKYLIYGVDYFIFSIKTPIGSLLDLNIDEPQKTDINLLSHSLLLVKRKKKNDLFFNDLIGMLKKRGAGSRYKSIIELQKYTGAEKDKFNDLKVITSPPKGGFKKTGFFMPPGVEGEYFFKLLKMLEIDKVTVFLIAIPEYIGTFRTNRFRRKFIRILRRIEYKHKNIKVLNFNKLKGFKLNNSDYFLDGGYGKTNSHLSKQGSLIFNHLLSERLKKYFLQLKLE